MHDSPQLVSTLESSDVWPHSTRKAQEEDWAPNPPSHHPALAQTLAVYSSTKGRWQWRVSYGLVVLKMNIEL